MSMRESIERRPHGVDDYRPLHLRDVAAVFRPRDLDVLPPVAEMDASADKVRDDAERLDELERMMSADPEREHAASFLRLPYGVVMSIARAIEGKPPGDDYDEDVARQATKMHRWATAKVAI